MLYKFLCYILMSKVLAMNTRVNQHQKDSCGSQTLVLSTTILDLDRVFLYLMKQLVLVFKHRDNLRGPSEAQD